MQILFQRFETRSWYEVHWSSADFLVSAIYCVLKGISVGFVIFCDASFLVTEHMEARTTNQTVPELGSTCATLAQSKWDLWQIKWRSRARFFRSTFGFLPTLIIPLMSLTHLSTPTTFETGPNRGHINTTAVSFLDTTRSFIVNLAM